MNLKPSDNHQLFGMDIFFNEIINLYNQKKMPNKILLSGKKGIGKSTLAYHLINYILSENEEYKYNAEEFRINQENKSYKLIQNHSHTNFYLIDLIEEKKSIDVAQIRNMITYTNKSCFNDMPRFVLIDNIESLNKNSVNALLKVIEEPNDGIFFILINNNEKKILPTLKSRCLIFKINLTYKQSINIAKQLLNKNISDFINHDILNHYITPGEIINLINFADDKKISLLDYDLESLLNIMIINGFYKKNNAIKKMIINLIESFFLKRYKLTHAKNTLLVSYHNFLNKIDNMEKSINVWTPLRGVNEDNTLRYVPDSHLINDDDIQTSSSDDKFTDRFSDGHKLGFQYAPKKIQSGVDINNHKPMLVNKYSSAIFNGNLIHGGAVNKSKNIRFSLDFRIIRSKDYKIDKSKQSHFSSGKSYFIEFN